METTTEKSKKGGKREGSGRKSTGRVTHSISVTPEEWEILKKLATESGKDVSRFIAESLCTSSTTVEIK